LLDQGLIRPFISVIAPLTMETSGKNRGDRANRPMATSCRNLSGNP
jgi:hypothetical protein